MPLHAASPRQHLAERQTPSQHRGLPPIKQTATTLLGKRRPVSLYGNTAHPKAASSIDEFGRPSDDVENRQPAPAMSAATKRSRHTLSPAKKKSPPAQSQSSTLPLRRPTTASSLSSAHSRIPRPRLSVDAATRSSSLSSAAAQQRQVQETSAGAKSNEDDDGKVFGHPTARSRTFSFVQAAPPKQVEATSVQASSNKKAPFVPTMKPRPPPPDSLRSKHQVVSPSITTVVTPSAVKARAAAWEKHVAATPSSSSSTKYARAPVATTTPQHVPPKAIAAGRFPRPSSSLAQRLAGHDSVDANGALLRPLRPLETPIAKERGLRRLSGQMAFPGTGRWISGDCKRLSSAASHASQQEAEQEKAADEVKHGQEAVENASAAAAQQPSTSAPTVQDCEQDRQATASDKEQRLQEELGKAHAINADLVRARDEMAAKLEEALAVNRRSLAEHDRLVDATQQVEARTRAETARVKSVAGEALVGQVSSAHSHLATAIESEVATITQQADLCRLFLDQLAMYETALCGAP